MDKAFDGKPSHLTGLELGDFGLVNPELSRGFNLLPSPPFDCLLKREADCFAEAVQRIFLPRI